MASKRSRRSCAGCGTPLPRLELVTDEGRNHVTGESWFRCRKCVLEAAFIPLRRRRPLDPNLCQEGC